MDAKQAKRILSTYRLGTWDDDDPAYTEALQVCAHDLELARWFEVQCRVDDTLRNRLETIPTPPDLKQKILNQRILEPRILEPATAAPGSSHHGVRKGRARSRESLEPPSVRPRTHRSLGSLPPTR